MHNNIGDTAGAAGDDRQSGGHGLHIGDAKGFVAGWLDKEVELMQKREHVFPVAMENNPFGQAGFADQLVQMGTVGSIADDFEAGMWNLAGDFSERLNSNVDTLGAGQAAANANSEGLIRREDASGAVQAGERFHIHTMMDDPVGHTGEQGIFLFPGMFYGIGYVDHEIGPVPEPDSKGWEFAEDRLAAKMEDDPRRILMAAGKNGRGKPGVHPGAAVQNIGVGAVQHLLNDRRGASGQRAMPPVGVEARREEFSGLFDEKFLGAESAAGSRAVGRYGRASRDRCFKRAEDNGGQRGFFEARGGVASAVFNKALIIRRGSYQGGHGDAGALGGIGENGLNGIFHAAAGVAYVG